MICHLSGLIGYVIPFGNILGPLIVWQLKKNEIPSVDQHGKDALNFQITVTIAILICLPLIFLVIGVVLMPLIGLAALVLMIIAGIKANNGEAYSYPFSLKLVK